MLIVLLDMSLRGDTDHPNDVIVMASFADLASEAFNSGGKSLNILDIPGVGDRFRAEPLSTDMFAWKQTVDQPGFHRGSMPLPVHDLNWHLVATSDTSHDFHEDAEGFCTSIGVETGAKLLFLAVPPGRDYSLSASVEMFREFTSDLSSHPHYSITGILLLPGDYMSVEPTPFCPCKLTLFI